METTASSLKLPSPLERLLGTWEFTMHHVDVSAPITGRQRYERTLDGAFVQLRWTYDHPDFPDAIALISKDQYHYFDVRGISRVFDLHISDDGWSMVHLDEEFSQRYTAGFRGPDAIDCTGEKSADHGATWQPDFRMTYHRVS